MSEQYQFLRYYIPGSLFLVYISGLALANSNESVVRSLGGLPFPQLLGAFVGFFVVSPPIGYVIYQLYDYTWYHKKAMSRSRRVALQLVDSWSEQESVTLDEVRKKELVDFAFYSSLKKSDLKISDQIAETIRGFWSHANARLVSSIYVPSLSLLFFFLVLIPISQWVPAWSFFALNVEKTALILGCMGISYVFLGRPAFATIREAFALEEFVLRMRESEIRKYMRTLRRQNTQQQLDS